MLCFITHPPSASSCLSLPFVFVNLLVLLTDVQLNHFFTTRQLVPPSRGCAWLTVALS